MGLRQRFRGPGRIRTVIKELEFEESLARIVVDAREADDFVRGVEWDLARNPVGGWPIGEGSPVWFIPIRELVDWLPVLVIYYTFDENNVWLLDIDISEHPQVEE